MAVAPYSTFTYKNPYIAQAKLSVTKAIFVQDLSSRNLVLLICDRTGLKVHSKFLTVREANPTLTGGYLIISETMNGCNFVERDDGAGE